MSEGAEGRTRIVGVDQETHNRSSSRQRKKRFLIDQFACKLEGGANVGTGEVVLALDFLERHASRKASDDDRHGNARAADDGFSVGYGGIDHDALVHKSERGSKAPSGQRLAALGILDLLSSRERRERRQPEIDADDRDSSAAAARRRPQRFSQLQRTELRQPQDSVLPAGADVLEPQAPGQALALVSRVAGALREEVAKRRILASQALRETGGGNRSEPLVPGRSLPL